MMPMRKDSPELKQCQSSEILKIEYHDLLLKECCGVGSFGTVYCADWISRDKCVAVKVVSHLDEEVNILSTLDHCNIIKFYGACYETPNFCIVSEYAPHGSLYSFLSSASGADLMFTQMLHWAKDIALGMKYLHEDASIQVVHRDLKSKNILIGHENCLKICDFGSSRVFDETVVMTFAGTYPWMAPELIQGLPTSTLCDVYSFGIVLWEILTKETPFKGLQGFQVAWIVVENHERPIIPSSCPQHLSNLIQQCWQGDPSFRPSFKEILLNLDSILKDGTLEKETNTFTRTRHKWVQEMASKMTIIKNNELQMWAEDNAAKRRNAILKRWTENLGKELMKHSMSSYVYESFRRSVSFSDESQVTVKSGHDSTTVGRNFAKNDAELKSSSSASLQKSSYQTNMSHVTEQDCSFNSNADHKKHMRIPAGIEHDRKLKRQLSVGSLEFSEGSNSSNVTDYRRHLSLPSDSESAILHDLSKTSSITVNICPAVIFEALACSLEMSPRDLNNVAHKLFKNIERVSAAAGDAGHAGVLGTLQSYKASCSKSGYRLDAECQTALTEVVEAATQTPRDVPFVNSTIKIPESGCSFTNSSGKEQEACSIDDSDLKNQLQSCSIEKFGVCAAKTRNFHAWTTARDGTGAKTLREENIAAGWKRKTSLLRDPLFNNKFL